MAAPTLDTVTDTILENADFEEQSSVSKARAFVTAAKQYLILSPQSQSEHGTSMTINTDQIERMMTRAQQFLERRAANSGSSSVRFLTASEGFRR